MSASLLQEAHDEDTWPQAANQQDIDTVKVGTVQCTSTHDNQLELCNDPLCIGYYESNLRLISPEQHPLFTIRCVLPCKNDGSSKIYTCECD